MPRVSIVRWNLKEVGWQISGLTDLISAGTITAVLRHGNVQASVEYTISKAVLPEEVPNAKISVPFTCKKITENLFNNGNN